MAREIDDILDRIAEILRQEKELLREGVFWRRLPRTGFDALELTAPIEWRPNAPHTNRGNAPAKLRSLKLYDRWYEFGLNRRLGVAGLKQTGPMIAEALPQEIWTFDELLAFLEQVWKVSGVSRVPTPPWEGRLI